MQIKLQEPASVHQMKLQERGDVKQSFASKARFIQTIANRALNVNKRVCVDIDNSNKSFKANILLLQTRRFGSLKEEERTLEFADPDKKQRMNNSFHFVTYHSAKKKKEKLTFSSP